MLYRQVKIDVTRYCNTQWMADNGVSIVQDVFLYMPEQKVHCCDIRPSYELMFVRTETDVEIDECLNSEDTSMYCAAIDRMKTTELGFFSFDEQAIEYANANWID